VSAAGRRIVLLNGSPRADSSVSLLLRELAAGAESAGAAPETFVCHELHVRPCVACGPDATDGYCIFHDDMDRVYAALEAAHAIVVGTPVYFDSVSGPMKLLFDRCNCITPLVTTPEGEKCLPKWPRTRRGVFVTAHSADHPREMAERSVRGFMKWVGARWEETIAWSHDDNVAGSVAREPALLERARAAGIRLATSGPLEDPAFGR
jgi:multimeric flavodoxin WrbA